MPLGMELGLSPGDFVLDGTPHYPPQKGGRAYLLTNGSRKIARFPGYYVPYLRPRSAISRPSSSWQVVFRSCVSPAVAASSRSIGFDRSRRYFRVDLLTSSCPVDCRPFPSVPRHRGGRRRVLPVGAGCVTSSGVTSPRRRRAMFLQFPHSTARQLSTRQSDVRDIHRVAQNRAVSRC